MGTGERTPTLGAGRGSVVAVGPRRREGAGGNAVSRWWEQLGPCRTWGEKARGPRSRRRVLTGCVAEAASRRQAQACGWLGRIPLRTHRPSPGLRRPHTGPAGNPDASPSCRPLCGGAVAVVVTRQRR
ncbi:hypothetical protein GQ55_5G127600 [Panicum hallii var. hallii]|uniref:Uncharacterized protein n=1 Tax=Panicum hallii var. hallii TaxID=1504633 RepID=A0A2T7DFN5_9POAL|nr:hypothetical protein GQ55_5G127600 [Panicum hallii var. hallii]